MAHGEQMRFVEDVREKFPDSFHGCTVLEVGSLDINGSVRSLFEGCEYTGLDVVRGKGVDVVGFAHEFDAEPGSFDTVISCEALEHDPFWRETLRKMADLLKPGGLLVITAAGPDRGEHGTRRFGPDESGMSSLPEHADHYRNLRLEDVEGAIGPDFAKLEMRYARGYRDLYAWGVKKAAAKPVKGKKK